MRRLTECLLTISLAAVSLGQAPVGAAMMTFSHTTNQQTVPFVDTFTLPGFNPALGTLTGVTVTINAAITGEVDVYNSSTTASSFSNAFVSVPVAVLAPDGSLTNVQVQASLASGTAQPGITRFPGLIASNLSSSNVAPANFGLYTGSGTNFVFATNFMGATAGGTMSPGSTGALFFGGSATAGGTTSVTYTYTTAVPEPTSLALVGCGMGGVGLITWRRRSASAAA